jgi:hypothetical protein
MYYVTSRNAAGSIPDRLDFFFIYLILPAALWPWTQPLTEMSTRNLPGDNAQLTGE